MLSSSQSVMPRVNLIFVVAAGIVLSQFQCVAACVVDSTAPAAGKSESVPPCHRHHDSDSKDQSPSCAHHVVVSPAALPGNNPIGVPAVLSVPVTLSAFVPLETNLRAARNLDVSPPGCDRPFSSTLRI
jgi:hypothetical protein